MRDSLRKICCLAPFLAAVVLVVALYFFRYDTVGTEDALARAASEYTETKLQAVLLQEIPGADGTCDGKGDLVLLCKSAGTGENGGAENSDGEKSNSNGMWNGIVLFERGINGRYVPVESTLYDFSVPVHDVSLKDGSMGFFGGGDGSEAVTVFFSCRYPEKMRRVEITCYDRDAYLEDGSIVPYTVTIETDGRPYMKIVPVSFHLYDRQFRLRDRDGQEMDRLAYSNDGNSRSRSSGSTSETWDKYGLILLAGAGLSWWLMKRRRPDIPGRNMPLWRHRQPR